MIRQLFRPRYGRYFDVAPRRWWDPRDRRSARIAAAVADHIWEKERPALVDCLGARLVADDRVPPDQIWIVP